MNWNGKDVNQQDLDKSKASDTVGTIAKKKAAGGKKANMTDIMDQDIEERDRIDIIALLEHGLAMKAQIGVQPDEKKAVEGSGLLKEMYDIKQQLGAHAASNGLAGLRHMDIVYTQRLQAGRTTVNPDKFLQFLVEHGVKAELVRAASAYATEEGDSFYVREITRL